MVKLYGLFLLFFAGNCFSQTYVVKSIKDFGAKGNGVADDHHAFKKASDFFNARKGAGKLIIPKGIYIIGKQDFTGKDPARNSFSYTGEYALDLRGCSNMDIVGNAGAVLRCRDSLRVGAFEPKTGKAFKHQMEDINVQAAYANYASTVGISIYLNQCHNILISGLKLDGNYDRFIFGGNWGSGKNPYELIHYGIFIIDSYNIELKKCTINKFATDGIYIVNIGKEVKTHHLNIDSCEVNYCGRNGLSWLGGSDIQVSNSSFSYSGQGLVHESPAAGIDIEVENNSACRNGSFYNCRMLNNVGSGITSGSGILSSDVLFKNCVAASPLYYSVFVDAPTHVFEDCTFYGTVLVWHKASGPKDAVKFLNCGFEEKYSGKKMYDGGYQLVAEAMAVLVDGCTFTASSMPNYYLNGLNRDCSESNQQKHRVSNSVFYQYGSTELKPTSNSAGTAAFTVFYNNKFYAKTGVTFLNRFNENCHADAGKNQFFTLNEK